VGAAVTTRLARGSLRTTVVEIVPDRDGGKLEP
jgi:hypothetical protein